MNATTRFFGYLLTGFLFMPLLAIAQHTAPLHLPPLTLDFPAGWVFDLDKDPAEGRGPNGEVAHITRVRQVPSGDATPPEQHAELAAQSVLMELATKGRTIVRPLTRFPAGNGKTGYSTVSQSKSLFGPKTYFIQYLLPTADRLFYITFLGHGEANAAMSRYDDILKTVRWDGN